MTYTVHESFLTLQGEGHHTGRVAVFCRFAGCNLWTGREQDRASAICRFCDTDFRGGEKFATAGRLASHLADLWPGKLRSAGMLVVLTGGEPLLQVDAMLTNALKWAGFTVAVETNGTQPRPPGIDWLCISPKAGAPLAITRADEVKLVYPQPDLLPDVIAGAVEAPVRSLQPMEGDETAVNEQETVRYCLEHPEWRLSLQTHKLLGLR